MPPKATQGGRRVDGCSRTSGRSSSSARLVPSPVSATHPPGVRHAALPFLRWHLLMPMTSQEHRRCDYESTPSPHSRVHSNVDVSSVRKETHGTHRWFLLFIVVALRRCHTVSSERVRASQGGHSRRHGPFGTGRVSGTSHCLAL